MNEGRSPKSALAHIGCRVLLQKTCLTGFLPNMKLLSKNILATAVLLGLVTAAPAQLYIATGGSGASAWFNFSIDAALNRVTVEVDNTHEGAGGAHGIVTSFGFNLPTGKAATGSLLNTVGVPDNSWSYFVPYGLNNFDQDAGAGSGKNVNGGQPSEGVQFGSTATFVFQFADFSDAAGFLGSNGVSLKWQSVSTTNQSDEAFGNPGTLEAPGAPFVPVPEPSTYGLIGAACLVIGTAARRHSAKVKALA
jgi:hypothetical protein